MGILQGPFEIVLFGDIIKDGPTNGLYLPQSAYGTGVPIVRIDSFRSGTGRLTSRALRRLRAIPAQVAQFALHEGDIVINRVNSSEHVGKSALVRGLDEPTVFESNMMRIRLESTLTVPDYVIEILQTPGIRSQIEPVIKPAVNQSSINQNDVRSLRIALPTLEVQREFAAKVAAIDAQRAVVERALALDDELFASLQHRAFRGEL